MSMVFRIVSAFSWYTSMVPVSATPPVMVTVFVMYTMARAMLVVSRVRTKATIPTVFFCTFLSPPVSPFACESACGCMC